MRDRSRRSLVWRVGWTLLFVQITVGVILGVSMFLRLKALYYTETVSQLERITPALVDRYATLLKSGETEAVNRAARIDAGGSDIRITVILPNGRVVGDSHHDVDVMENHGARPEIADAVAKGRGSASRRSGTIDTNLIYHAVRIDGPDGHLGVVRVALPLAEVNTRLTQLASGLGLAAAAWLAITFAAIVYFSTRMSQQLARLVDSAKRFASGQLGHRLEPATGREFSDLSTALNEMATQLNAQFDEIQTQRNEQAAILRSMEAGVLAVDLDRRVIRLNRAAAEMLNTPEVRSRGELIENAIEEPSVCQFISEALGNSGGSVAELELKSSNARHVRAVARPLRNAEDRQIGAVVVLGDITRLRRLEAMRSNFASNVSHELRTPITNIKGYAETLLESDFVEGEGQRFVDVIARNANRLGAIIEDLMVLTRVEQSALGEEIEAMPTALLPVLTAACEDFAGEAAAKPIDIVIECEPDLTAVLNRVLIERAIGNLLSNAIRYSPAETTVVVRGAPQRGPDGEPEVCLSVADQGPGIAREHQARLFERFYRVDKARSRELGGTGLGLAIVKHIASVHNGAVEVDSEPGRGSTFRIVFPLGLTTDEPPTTD